MSKKRKLPDRLIKLKKEMDAIPASYTQNMQEAIVKAMDEEIIRGVVANFGKKEGR